MSNEGIRRAIEELLTSPPAGCGELTNERSLQLELAYIFRRKGWSVRFEVPLRAKRLEHSTLKPKQYLDLLVEFEGGTAGIELKVPMNGQHPETMYAFCADLEFVESIKRAGHVSFGFCLMVTNDSAFWADSGRGSDIHNRFRTTGRSLEGIIAKPTGAKNSCLMLENSYVTAGQWRSVNSSLILGGQYLLVNV